MKEKYRQELFKLGEKVFRYKSNHDDILRDKANYTLPVKMIVLIHWETR